MYVVYSQINDKLLDIYLVCRSEKRAKLYTDLLNNCNFHLNVTYKEVLYDLRA